MIAFFPDIYPDELVYSLFARYHVCSGNISFKATAEELFAHKNIIPSPEFFVPLTQEAYRAVTRSKSGEAIISGHTMLPYYTRFLPLERRQAAFHRLQTMDRTFYDALYIRQKKTKGRKYMRYCPICAAQDRNQYGETYWHRKHQLTEVDICLRHNCRLENSTVEIAADRLRFKLIHAETVVPSHTSARMDVSALEYRVAEYVMAIFLADMDFENPVAPGKFLRSRLEGTPYISLRGEQVYSRALFADLTEYYKDLPQFTLEAWWYVQKIFCSQNFHTYDICLIALFLGIPAEDLLHMTLPELTLQQRFDSRLGLLRSQGMTQKQAARAMGISLHAVKGVEEKRKSHSLFREFHVANREKQ